MFPRPLNGQSQVLEISETCFLPKTDSEPKESRITERLRVRVLCHGPYRKGEWVEPDIWKRLRIGRINEISQRMVDCRDSRGNRCSNVSRPLSLSINSAKEATKHSDCNRKRKNRNMSLIRRPNREPRISQASHLPARTQTHIFLVRTSQCKIRSLIRSLPMLSCFLLTGVECLAAWPVRLHQRWEPKFCTNMNEEHTPINICSWASNSNKHTTASRVRTTWRVM